jgi:predicted tellurium resistance membrane protein TerC
MEVFLNPDAWIALLTLTFLEIVGIEQHHFHINCNRKITCRATKKTTKIGMFLAMFMRIALCLVLIY